MSKIIIAATLALIGTPALCAPQPANTAEPSAAMARLRAQNDALREQMGRMQLDLLIADMLARQEHKAGGTLHREAGVSAQVVALRK